METSNKKYVSSGRVYEPCLMSGTPTIYEQQKQAFSLGTHLLCEILSEFRQSSCSQNQSLHICYDPV